MSAPATEPLPQVGSIATSTLSSGNLTPGNLSSPPPALNRTPEDINKSKEKSYSRQLPILHTTTPNAETSLHLVVTKPTLSQRKKYWLLALFSYALFIEVWSGAALFIFISSISNDLNIIIEQQSWVITSFTVTFASFLLFWGRLSDLFSPKKVFGFGFIALGALTLVVSFLPDQYSFFVVRALSGVAAAAVIPAAYRLVVVVFEEEELGFAFTLMGASGTLANTSGLVVAGLVQSIPGTGQMVAWRWFFRIMSLMILPFAFGSLYWIPTTPSQSSSNPSKYSIWKRLDLVGSSSIFLSILLLIIGLTLGASYGWRTPQFLVPFLLFVLLFPLFFIWESRQPDLNAVLPKSTWSIPNFTVFIVFALYILPWWVLSFLPYTETFLQIHEESPIIVAVRMLPQGVSAGMIGLLLTLYPRFVTHPRWPIVIGISAGLVGYILFIFSGGRTGIAYWQFTFPGMIIGSAGTMTISTVTSVGVMRSVPPEMAGVAGAVLSSAFQLGPAVALSIQAGLLTVQPGNVGSWINVRASFIFVSGWGVMWLVGFLIFFKPIVAKKEAVD